MIIVGGEATEQSPQAFLGILQREEGVSNAEYLVTEVAHIIHLIDGYSIVPMALKLLKAIQSLIHGT